MNLYIISFTSRGGKLGEYLANRCSGRAFRCKGKNQDGIELKVFTKEAFEKAEGIVFIGAAGIAVRAIAPYLQDKTMDPAVVVVDERAHYAIPILSGHLGGANDLARSIAALTGAEAVITTATDINGVFAVDEWARVHGWKVENTERIKDVSSRLLQDKQVVIYSHFPIQGPCPQNVVVSRNWDEIADAALTIRTGRNDILKIIPPVLYLGIGCKAGTSKEAIEEVFEKFLASKEIHPDAVAGAASIEVKKNEKGLLEFCAAHGWKPVFYSANELNAVEGEFEGSEFVKQTVGTDNVCERSAVKLSKGILMKGKTAENGITMALAYRTFYPDWRWKYE